MSAWEHEHVDAPPPEGTPSWLELNTPDPGRAREFYGALFGWTFEDDLCLLNGLPIAAIRPLGEGYEGPEWTVFFAADDCDGVAGRVSAAGGRIVRAPYEDGMRGRAALVSDTVGARFGLWQGRELVGTRLVNGYGTFIFNELYTVEQEKTHGFYREVFGYRPLRSGGEADLVRHDSHTVASIGFPEPAQDEEHLKEIQGSFRRPGITAWMTYFAVEDATDAVNVLLEAGGQVHTRLYLDAQGQSYEDGVEECPWGRIAAVKDPFGTPFRLIEAWDVI